LEKLRSNETLRIWSIFLPEGRILISWSLFDRFYDWRRSFANSLLPRVLV
jgi:hypothetical protein